MTKQLYFDNPLNFDFTANVTQSTDNNNDTAKVILDSTYFYPISFKPGSAHQSRHAARFFASHSVRYQLHETSIHRHVDKPWQ